MSAAARWQAWLDGLQPRERRVLVLGGAAVALILFVGGLLTLGQRVGAAQARVEQKTRDLAFIQQAAAEVLAAGPLQPGGPAGEPLAVLAERAAREAGLASSLAGTETTTDGGLRLSFRDAGFDPLAAMLARLSAQSGARVESATIDAAGEAGRVNAMIVLRLDTRG